MRHKILQKGTYTVFNINLITALAKTYLPSNSNHEWVIETITQWQSHTSNHHNTLNNTISLSPSTTTTTVTQTHQATSLSPPPHHTIQAATTHSFPCPQHHTSPVRRHLPATSSHSPRHNTQTTTPATPWTPHVGHYHMGTHAGEGARHTTTAPHATHRASPHCFHAHHSPDTTTHQPPHTTLSSQTHITGYTSYKQSILAKTMQNMCTMRGADDSPILSGWTMVIHYISTW